MTAANDSFMRERIRGDCRPRYVLLGALFLLAMILFGCTPYWTRSDQTVKSAEPRIVIALVTPCAGVACYVYETHTIWIRADFQHKDCAKSHELKHARGWTHDGRRQFSYDCGDGKML